MMRRENIIFVILYVSFLCDASRNWFVSNGNFKDYEDNNKKLERNNKSVHHYHKKIEENDVFNTNKTDWLFKGFNLNYKIKFDEKPAAGSILYHRLSTRKVCHQSDRNLSSHLLEKHSKKVKQKVLLISIDGFRWDYRSKASTPHLNKIVKEGVSAEFVLNVFPTAKLPNQQSLVTGLYPEHHGMISETMRDSSSGLIFNGDSDSGWWNNSTPIWITNQKQGHQSGISFWPGYRVKYGGMQPSYLPEEKYSSAGENAKAVVNVKSSKIMPVEERIKQAVDWLKNKDVTFVALHIETVDKVAHIVSPDSGKTNIKRKKLIEKAITSADRNIGLVQKLLTKNNLQSNVNVIVVGDHGSVNANYTQMIVLDEYLDVKEYIKHVDGVTSVFLTAKPNRKKQMYEILSKQSKRRNSHFQVYLKEDIPEYFHIKNSNRVGDLLLLPKPGWTVFTKKNMPSYYKGRWRRGEHGYSNIEATMNPAFFACGPSFRVGYKQWCVKTIDLYSLMCHILNIRPEPHDGCFERVKPFLKEFRGKNYRQVNERDDPIIC